MGHRGRHQAMARRRRPLVADSVKVIRNHETQESKGFAFIEAPTSDEMQAIIRRFDGEPSWKTRFFEPRPRRSPPKGLLPCGKSPSPGRSAAKAGTTYSTSTTNQRRHQQPASGTPRRPKARTGTQERLRHRTGQGPVGGARPRKLGAHPTCLTGTPQG